MEWIIDNAAWIRDIFTPVFALALVIVAVLTYLRAKETILRPLRSEVVKRQSQKMSELLEFVSDSQVSAGDKIDYFGLCQLNTLMWLNEYGFILSNQDQLIKDSQSVYDGFIQRETQDGILHDIELPTLLSTPSDKPVDEELKKYRRLRYEKAKSGNLEVNDIEKIFLTKRYAEYSEHLDAFARDPFLPSTTLKILQEFKESIHINVAIILQTTIAEFITASLAEISKEPTVNFTISPLAVYNIFNHKRLHHTNTLQLLWKNIREHLRIDSTP